MACTSWWYGNRKILRALRAGTDPWVRRLGFAFGPLLRWAMRRGLLSAGKR